MEDLPTAHNRDLTYDRLDSFVDRCNPQDVPTTVADTPYRDLVFIHIWSSLSITDGILEIGDLQLRDYFSTRNIWVIVRKSKITIVEHENGDGEVGNEVLSDQVETHFLGG